MDINCVLNCKHQENGKCTLIEIPLAFSRSVHIDAKKDCAYFEKATGQEMFDSW